MFGAPYTPDTDTVLTTEGLMVGRPRGLSLRASGVLFAGHLLVDLTAGAVPSGWH